LKSLGSRCAITLEFSEKTLRHRGGIAATSLRNHCAIAV
jgi:hypothetical protein